MSSILKWVDLPTLVVCIGLHAGNNNVTFALVGSQLTTDTFEIDHHTGAIAVKNGLDRETTSEFNFIVVVSVFFHHIILLFV
jgi:hypothetical protein